MFYYRFCLQKKLCVAPSLLSIKGIKKGTDEMSQQSKIFIFCDGFWNDIVLLLLEKKTLQSKNKL